MGLRFQDVEEITQAVAMAVAGGIIEAKGVATESEGIQAAGKMMQNEALDRIMDLICKTHGTTIEELGMKWIEENPEHAIKEMEEGAIAAGKDPEQVIPTVEAVFKARREKEAVST